MPTKDAEKIAQAAVYIDGNKIEPLQETSKLTLENRVRECVVCGCLTDNTLDEPDIKKIPVCPVCLKRFKICPKCGSHYLQVDKGLEMCDGCRKNLLKKEKNSDVGEEAMALAIKHGGRKKKEIKKGDDRSEQ